MKDEIGGADIYGTINDRIVQKNNLPTCNNSKIIDINDNVLEDINILLDEKDELGGADIYGTLNDI